MIKILKADIDQYFSDWWLGKRLSNGRIHKGKNWWLWQHKKFKRLGQKCHKWKGMHEAGKNT